MWDVHEEGQQEEVGEKSCLKRYRLAKDDFGQEWYVKKFGSKGKVRQRFRFEDGISRTLG